MTSVAIRKSKTRRKSLWRIDDPQTEMMAFCPTCKALEILRFEGRVLIPTRKFTQKAGKVYHSCDAGKPCRLHRFGGRDGLGHGSLRFSPAERRRKA